MKIFYFFSYCLDLTRLRHLGFPLDSELNPGKTIVYVDPDIGLRSCTKAEGDLNSLEFCVDDFSSNDVKTESISNSINSQVTSPKTFQIISMQIEQDKSSKELKTRQEVENQNLAKNISQEESHKNTHNKSDLEEILCQPSTGPEDLEELSSTEEDHTILSSLSDNANLSQSSGVLDVNAQEFVPSNLNLNETLPIPSRGVSSTPISLSANAKEFYPSSSYSNPSPLSVSLNASESEVETRKCARCDKV